MAFHHVTVLRDAVVRLLEPRPGARFVDCTLGGGGHSEAFLQAGAQVLGLDRDPAAIQAATHRLVAFPGRLQTAQARFSQLPEVLARAGWQGVDGLVADLGVSSPQVDLPDRGFSFQHDGPLDMRMGPDAPCTAAELLQGLDEAELTALLRDLGGERQARRIARAIIAALPLHSTGALARVIEAAVPRHGARIHPATRTFQALRMAVNAELDELDSLLAALPGVLLPGGRAAIISFHSGEDARVKARFRSLAGVDTPRDAFGHPASPPLARLVTRKAVSGEDEDPTNPRARSARLRVIVRA